MPARIRELLPSLLLAALGAAAAWALWLPAEAPADFTFVNGTEPKSLDPQLVTGQPEGRLTSALFDRLVRWDPETLAVMPGLAERWEISADATCYTFHLQEAVWSDGVPLDAAGVVASWRRFLDPATAAEYAYQLWPIRGARDYSRGRIAAGDRVEVECDTHDRERPFGRGTLHRGTVVWVGPAAELGRGAGAAEPAFFGSTQAPRRPGNASNRDGLDGTIVAEVDGTLYAPPGHRLVEEGEAVAARAILPDFAATVGLAAPDSRTLVVELAHPTPYFLHLCGFYPLAPVPIHVIERHGSPGWTQPGRLVSSGAFRLHDRRLRDRVRLVRNERYTDADRVRLAVVDALAVDSTSTALALFETAAVDWAPAPPPFAAKLLAERRDPHLVRSPELTVGFYRLNTTRPPLNDPRVRQALSRALDRRAIVTAVYGPGEPVSLSFVPAGIGAATGYVPPETAAEDPAAAARLLAEAGFPGGRGFPTITISFNADAGHQMVAELVQAQWKSRLGIDVDLVAMEWGAFLDAQSRLDFWVARAGWVADYVDPNTFLDMFVSGGANNQTGFASPAYDQLIAEAGRTTDRETRNRLFHEAETQLLEELPVLPLFTRSSKNLVAPWVRGFHGNPLDIHPLEVLEVDRAARDRARRARRLPRESAP